MMGYLKVNGNRYQKIFVVGDLHGCYDLLMSKLSDAGFDFKHDLLIAVGDLIDRGTQNLECLRLINENWFKTVRGNHEQMAINGINGDEQSLLAWQYNGGGWFFKLNDLDKQEAVNLINKCNELPLVIELSINNELIAFAHADYPANEYVFNKPIDLNKVIWSRERFEKYDNAGIKGVEFFVFGHTPQREVTQVANRVYIDTGAVFSGNLVLTRIDNI
ncbi:MAG: metallophosphoesterase [Gilliamella sp.]|uniref:metallophosphoesterase n=1 Tax=Gilliamella sp. TaxID=1891236 RepID=UPI0025E2A50C|nr:metallophosphoesterase [Gilliamella sp.]MCO6551131.1 metallophosphoesterase [Gilliamella sp.]